LAAKSGVFANTIKSFESGVSDPKLSTLHNWRRALEAVGAMFIDPDDQNGPGVRLRGATAGLALMRRIDKLRTEFPFAGARMLCRLLAADGSKVGRRHVKTLMDRMGVEALYRRPRTTRPEPGHKIYPYLLRGVEITRPNQVWAMDITYIAMA
jgi:transcriptional regulator with XRE-family HTH domain